MKKVVMTGLLLLSSGGCFGMEQSSQKSTQELVAQLANRLHREEKLVPVKNEWLLTVAQWKKDYFDQADEDNKKRIASFLTEIAYAELWLKNDSIKMGHRDNAQAVQERVESFKRHEKDQKCPMAKSYYAIMLPIMKELEESNNFEAAVAMCKEAVKAISGPNFTCKIVESTLQRKVRKFVLSKFPADAELKALDVHTDLHECCILGMHDSAKDILHQNPWLCDKEILNGLLITTVQTAFLDEKSAAVVELLLENGASADTKNKEGISAVEIAKSKDYIPLTTQALNLASFRRALS